MPQQFFLLRRRQRVHRNFNFSQRAHTRQLSTSLPWRQELNAAQARRGAMAMKNATDNAVQFIKDLTLEYNKLRQANITKELLEISSAAMAMA